LSTYIFTMAAGEGAGTGSGKGKGRGKGRGCYDLFCGESMVWIWFVILGMVLCIFVIVGITGIGRVDVEDVDGLGGGPWWAWMIAVTLLLFVFVVVYLISMQYAEPVMAYKLAKDDDAEAGLPLTKKEKTAASS
jgi:type VI protein secretion system component VasK